MFFCYLVITSTWKIWTNLNPLHPRMLYAKFGWNWPIGSWEEVENRKSLQTDGQTDRRTDRRMDGQTTDERWSKKLTWAFSSGELKTYKERQQGEKIQTLSYFSVINKAKHGCTRSVKKILFQFFALKPSVNILLKQLWWVKLIN